MDCSVARRHEIIAFDVDFGSTLLIFATSLTYQSTLFPVKLCN